MNVLTLCYEFPPIGGGGSHVVAGLSAELVRAGHDIDIVSMRFGHLRTREVASGARIHRVSCFRRSASICSPPEMGLYLARALPLAQRLTRERPYDLIHAHFIFPDGVLARTLHRRTGLPYVITAHGSDVPGYNPDRFRLLHRLLQPMWQRVVSEAALVVSPSTNLSRLIQHARPSARIVEIPNGIAPGKYRADRVRAKRLLVVARLFERKGVQHLIEALAGVEHDHEIHVVGTGPFQDRLVALAAGLRVPVIFHGWLEPDSPQLRELYETASIFVLPSHMENFPIVLLEAMTAGLAIVTTRGTGCDEVVADAGILVRPGDVEALRAAVVGLMQDPLRCRALGRAANRHMRRRFSWAAVAARYVDVYAAVLRGATTEEESAVAN